MISVDSLPGCGEADTGCSTHFVSGVRIVPPFADGLEIAEFALGCFWGAERLFWQQPGVVATAVGYAGGSTVQPSYRQVCTGRTGHAEVVRVVFDPKRITYQALLCVFWENHDPTQGMRQGNDVGTQYRSMIFAHSPEQMSLALVSRDAYAQALAAVGLPAITTEVVPAGAFHYAEDYHQQYLAKNPHGYCGIAGTGVACPEVAKR